MINGHCTVGKARLGWDWVNNNYYSDLWLLCLCKVILLYSLEKTDK